MVQKTALSVQSLACHGKCSLTEALPIISVCGISLSVLPTVVLSTHTGGFGEPERIDTTEFLANSLEHYRSEKIKFNGIYTGYFADRSQIELLTKQINGVKESDALVLVDPVLGDKGKFFSGINEEFIDEMLSLCKTADVILPNITESCFLCGEKYKENPTENELLSLAVKLFNITKAQVVITGVENKNKIGALIFDGENAEFIYSKKIHDRFHGTGDMFSSIVFACLLKGKSLKKSVVKAQKFITDSINKTISATALEKNGLNFENSLKNLI